MCEALVPRLFPQNIANARFKQGYSNVKSRKGRGTYFYVKSARTLNVLVSDKVCGTREVMSSMMRLRALGYETT